jgi:diaminohydroxyphosphoribosylaminopyrimidine deaminase/5-amino-6-(5-phosphoribosylamino)uracil reductase
MNSPTMQDKDWLDQAAALAWKGVSNTAPNPMVGAIFVDEKGEIISQGWHQRYGEAHAEKNAILAAVQEGKSLAGGTLYVTLEPCSHQGKQPPCANQLLDLGLKRVVYAAKDPNPLVSGQGIKKLEANGIKTEHIQTTSTQKLNAGHIMRQTHNRPLFHLKAAVTIDGKITLEANTKTTLSNKASQKKVHQLRAQHDAILIGRRTLEIDDPQLTNRLSSSPHQPIRIILDTHLEIDPEANVFKQPGETWVIHSENTKSEHKLKQTQFIPCPTQNNQIDIKALAKILYEQGLRRVLVEGGSQIHTSFINQELQDEISLIMSPILSEKPSQGVKLAEGLKIPHSKIACEWVDTDLWITKKTP